MSKIFVPVSFVQVVNKKDLHREHAQVLDALRARDPVVARQAMQEHFRNLLESMLDVTEEQALNEIREKAAESRQRYLNSVAG